VASIHLLPVTDKISANGGRGAEITALCEEMTPTAAMGQVWKFTGQSDPLRVRLRWISEFGPETNCGDWSVNVRF
jgi:hypothetical protein